MLKAIHHPFVELRSSAVVTIKNPNLHRAAYHIVSDIIKAGQVPTDLIHPGTRMLRTTDRKYTKITSEGQLALSSAAAAMTIRNAYQDVSRWSGISTMRGKQVGAIYLSEVEAANFNETLWYFYQSRSQNNFLPKGGVGLATEMMRGKMVLDVIVTHPLCVFDLSLHENFVMDLIGILQKSSEVKTAIPGHTTVLDIYRDPGNCDIERAIALAAADSKIFHGIRAGTVRMSERSADESGNNVIVFGEQDEIAQGLAIVRAIDIFNGSSHLVEFVPYAIRDKLTEGEKEYLQNQIAANSFTRN
jgi:hypothetical protein